MAAKIPMTFMRTAEAFEMIARSKGYPGSSSGSEYDVVDDDDKLFDRVNAFIEREDGDDFLEDEGYVNNICERKREGSNNEFEQYERDSLRDLLSIGNGDFVRGSLRDEVEKAYSFSGGGGGLLLDFKRRLMMKLREKGFDAGLCKSKWEKTGPIPCGNYEYIDVKIAGTRYIIESFLADEFEIARPSEAYTSLLKLFPPIFVGKIEELMQIGEIMCKAIKLSLKNMEMPVPPWRRYRYFKAKWLSSYKRTINEVSEKLGNSNEILPKKIAPGGFSPLPITRNFNCRNNFDRKVGVRVGHLAMAMNEIR